ncbi:alpha-amylase family glycosyl hydrolase [Oceanithermus sp.]|uniref:alpha-amylase family glycosyl hydrolase n=1 Tax=Oceanithermus sp. TaxID=2268145 RepID=UPI0025F8A6EA|nr:alpha-amylase family glycosyl hydrolase [Oceanithermus sp.]
MVKLAERLAFLYGPAAAERWAPVFAERVERFARAHPALARGARALATTPAEVWLITYGDQVTREGEAPLATLARFVDRWLAPEFSGVHLLPIYPYSSDDGFSVIDYRAVDPRLGGWDHVRALAERYALMLDAVINHASAESAWFQGFLRCEEPYRRYFLEPPEDWDLSRVVRPRTTPLLTEFQTACGPKRVWTTFSADQVDLNYREPKVLLEVLDLLLFYAAHGARRLRLDAVGFVWKEPGTTCLNLPQTHEVVKLFRTALDVTAPEVALVTETNVPHAENVAYFGNGEDEAQLVYNFALPPLVLHAFARGDARTLARWAAGLELPGPRAAFLNFLASHDGIGLRPVEGILPPEEVAFLVERTLAHGGEVSYRDAPGGPAPYELNTTWYDALNPPGTPEALGVRRLLASHAIMLALAGLPAVYVHALFGTPNWREGYERSGEKRRLNRRKFREAEVEAWLGQPRSRPRRILEGLKRMLRARAAHPAFHPAAAQEVLELGPHLFGVDRAARGARARVVVNVGPTPQRVPLPAGATNLLGGERLGAEVWLQPYDYLWAELPD